MARIWLGSFRGRPLAVPIQRRKQRHPQSHVVVANAARRLFHVRLKMKNGIAVLRMARSRDLGELLDDVVPFANKKFGENVLVQMLKQFPVTSHGATVEERNRKLHVLHIKLLAFGQGTGRRPQLHTKVPEFLAERSDGFAQCVFGGAVGVQEKDVNVRMRKQGAAAKSTQCNQGKIFWTVSSGAYQLIPQPQKDSLH